MEMNRRALAPLAALALVTTACGGLDLAGTETTASERNEGEGIEDPETTGDGASTTDGADDTSDTSDTADSDTDGAGTDGAGDADTDGPDSGAQAEETAQGDADDGSDDGEPVPDAGSSLESGEQDDEPSDGGGRATPEELDLDLTQRHPGGTGLEVSGLRFEGNTILVDAEFINGATKDVRIRTSGGQSLRLQDDVGNTYNFVLPDDLHGDIDLSQGETIGGEFAFLGPVDPRAEKLVVVTNIYDPVNLPLNPDALFRATSTPEFALEGLELSW